MIAPQPFQLRRHPADDRWQAVRATQIRLAVPGWVRRRPLLYAPLFVTIVSVLALSGFPAGRVWTVVAIYGALMTLWTLHAVRGSLGSDDVERSVVRTGTITGLVQACVVALTGGLASPLLVLLIGPPMSTAMLFGRSRESTFSVGLLVATALALGLMPQSWAGPHIGHPYDAVLGGAALLFNIIILMRNILLVTDIHQQAGRTIDRMREDILTTATERAQSLESIGAKVAHELKNPLSAVKGLVQLVSRGAADERSRARFEVIAAEVTRMEAILRDYLSFSRPLDDLRPQRLRLAPLCDDVVAVLEARAQAAHVRLQRTGDATVTGDPRRLKEALLNLVANALEATQAKGAVEVRIQERDDGATITVRDTGVGLSADDLARLGTPFFSKREGGTGLGVVLAKSVIVQHGGSLAYASEPRPCTPASMTLPRESTPGLGTTATVTLPREPPDRNGTPDGQTAAH